METTVASGEVICIKVPYPRSVKRFVQKRVGQWLSHQTGVARKLKDAYFKVKFERFGAGHDVSCTIILLVSCLDGSQRCWRGMALADGLHKSLIFSLEHLVPRIERNVDEIQPNIA